MSLGETAGRYRVHGRIAAGGMGEVYRASMETVGGVEKSIALKVVKGQLARDGDFAALFVEEAKVAMTLSHANVVQAFDVGRIDERWFLAMEYVEGVNLAELIGACRERLGQPVPHRHVLFIAVEALKGLDYAHRRRGPDGQPLHIVHRDVSPGNLLISLEGEVKVADFGIAKSTMRSFGSMAGTVKGKIPYMAPEQLRGSAADRRADIYSVGAVLYEMLTGQRPVEDEAPTQAIPRVLAGSFPPVRSLAASVPVALEVIVTRAMSTDPSERYGSAAAMRQELEQLAMREGYLLSSSDLADFVAEVMGVDERGAAAGVRGRAVNSASGTLAPSASGSGADVPAERIDEARASGGDPFDALLGLELEKVNSGEPFSVFTSAEGRRLETAPRASGPSALPGGERAERQGEPAPVETGTVPGFPSRRRRRGTAAAAGGLLVAALAVVGVVTATRTSPASPAGPTAERAAVSGHGAGRTASEDVAPPPVGGGAVAERAAEGPGDGPTEGNGPEGETVAATPPAPIAAAETEDDPIPEPRRREARRRQARRTGTADRAPRTMAARPTAAATTTPEPTAAPTTAPEPVAATGSGTLSVNTDPWSYVYLDGEQLGPTPQLGKSVAAGRHRLRLHNPSEGLERTIVIDVSPGENERVTLDLRN